MKNNRVVVKFQDDAPLPEVKVKSKKIAGRNDMFNFGRNELGAAKNEFNALLDHDNKNLFFSEKPNDGLP